MGKGKRYTVAQFPEGNQRGSGGNSKSPSPDRLGCTWNTVQKWIEDKPQVP